jgi:hypothetical protein
VLVQVTPLHSNGDEVDGVMMMMMEEQSDAPQDNGTCAAGRPRTEAAQV